MGSGRDPQRVIESARNNGIAIRVAKVRIAEVLAADELFLANSVIGVWQAAALERKTWNSGTLTTRVRSWLSDVQDC